MTTPWENLNPFNDVFITTSQHDVSYFDKWSNKFLTLNQILKNCLYNRRQQTNAIKTQAK